MERSESLLDLVEGANAEHVDATMPTRANNSTGITVSSEVVMAAVETLPIFDMAGRGPEAEQSSGDVNSYWGFRNIVTRGTKDLI